MADVEKHIKELLYTHDKVVVPGLGTFYTKERSADIHPATGDFSPASREVFFDESQKENDDVLVSAIAFYESLPYQKALKEIQGFVYDIRQRLKESNSYQIKGLGKFKIGSDYSLNFEFDDNSNFNTYSFGLPSFKIKPVDKRQEPEPKTSRAPKAEPSQTNSKASRGIPIPFWVYVLLPLVILAVLFLLFFRTPEAEKSLNKVNIVSGNEGAETEESKAYMDSLDRKQKKKKETKGAPIEEQMETDKVASDEAEVIVPKEEEMEREQKAESVTYHVVFGSFEKREFATRQQRRLSQKGYPVVILDPEPGKRLFKVSIAQFGDEEEALKKLRELEEKEGKQLWLLAYDPKGKAITE